MYLCPKKSMYNSDTDRIALGQVSVLQFGRGCSFTRTSLCPSPYLPYLFMSRAHCTYNWHVQILLSGLYLSDGHWFRAIVWGIKCKHAMQGRYLFACHGYSVQCLSEPGFVPALKSHFACGVSGWSAHCRNECMCPFEPRAKSCNWL